MSFKSHEINLSSFEIAHNSLNTPSFENHNSLAEFFDCNFIRDFYKIGYTLLKGCQPWDESLKEMI
jgi:hypothetical protein